MRTKETVELVKGIAHMLARYPDKLNLRDTTLGPATIVRISPAKQDYGKLVGTRGTIIRALQLIAKEAARDSNFEVIVEESDRTAEGSPTLKWDAKGFCALVEKAGRLIFDEATFAWDNGQGSHIVAISIKPGYDTEQVETINKAMSDLFDAVAYAGRHTIRIWIAEATTK